MFQIRNSTVNVLECTLRDGGQGIESLRLMGIETPGLEEWEKNDIIKHSVESGADIIELGYITSDFTSLYDLSMYASVEDLSTYIFAHNEGSPMFTGLYIDPDTSPERIPQKTSEIVPGIRVIIRYSELEKSLNFCRTLAEKGYKVFVQPMLTMRYSDGELDRLIDTANEIQAYALYIVDSFGYMNESDIERIYMYYEKRVNGGIKIGFHAHNNLDNAFANAKFFLEKMVSRDCIIDSCTLGMGQGAGNLQTEVLYHYLNEKYDTNYKIDPIIKIFDILSRYREGDMTTWGYSPMRYISAIHNAAYKYAIVMRKKYGMSYAEINETMKFFDNDLRHRYTPENLNKLFLLSKGSK